MPIPATSVNVPVESAVSSKTNWTQFIGVGASLLTILSNGKLNLTPDQLLAAVAGFQAVQGIVSVVLKTYFTGSVTPAVAAKMVAAQ